MERSLRENRRPFSRIGWGFALMLFASMLLQMAAVLLIDRFAPAFSASPWYTWVVSTLPMYCIGAPLCLLVLSGQPRVYVRDNRLGFGMLCICFIICYSTLYLGNLLGTGINFLLGLAKGGAVSNPVTNLLAEQSPWLTALFVVLLAPLVEELLCRKLVIDRLAPFGDRTAILVSALVFGLLHGNFQQFFYAFGVGLVLGYVYIRSGRVYYTMGIHMLLNFMGSLFPMLLLEGVDLEALEQVPEDPEVIARMLPMLLVILGYAALVLVLVISGIVLFFVFRKRIRLYPGEYDLPGRRFRTVILNPGMLALLVITLGLFTLNIVL